ncbi:MAG: multicopper oxidase domain-containing protein [bacterium]|nr:multicopper oxidase domain-containing protein [bacterium]
MNRQDPDGGLPRTSRRPSRRHFLAGLGGAGLTATAAPLARAATLPTTWNLEAVQTSYTFATGASLPYFRLQAVGTGATRGLLPYFEATEGTTIDIAIDNQLPVAIRPSVVSVADGPVIPANTSATFQLVVPPAGTYLVGPARAPWSSGVESAVHAAPLSGLAAILVSRPTSGLSELWNGGPSFDREFVLVYEDADDRLNTAMVTPGAQALPPYEPNFFTVNGLAYPETIQDVHTLVTGAVGERILIRLGNLGRMRQAVHFHGYHAEPVARDNVPEQAWPAKDTFPLPAFGTLDVILTPHQRGTYPLHPHSLTAVTAGGLYPFGQLTLMAIN